MKGIILITITIITFNLTLKSQYQMKINSSNSHYLSDSYFFDDTLFVRYNDGLINQQMTGNETYRVESYTFNNGVNFEFVKTLDSIFLVNTARRVILDSGIYFDFGIKSDSGVNKNSKIWYKSNLLIKDSTYYFYGFDSINTGLAISNVVKVKNSIYLFGTYLFENYPYSKSFGLKYNASNHQITFKSHHCYGVFCYVNGAIYDKTSKEFIVTSTRRFGDTIAPYGAGIAKLDTNLNLIPNTAQKIDVDYSQYFPQNAYSYSADIEWVNDSLFLTAGTVNNAQQLPSQTSNPNHNYGNDVAVSLRSSATLQEVNTAKVYGKVDTAENEVAGQFLLEKFESNLYVVVTNSRFYTYTPEPWNTSLALFGLDSNGNKHWEYYMPYNDYCWARQAHPTSDGGLWVCIQCSGNLNQQAGTYDYFGKVAYIDSIAYWPRIGTVGEKEIKKEANHFVVYPNPTSDYLKVKQYGLITELYYEVYDQSGRLLKSKKSAEHQVELNLQDLAKGFYILRITNRNGELIKTEKVVKQ